MKCRAVTKGWARCKNNAEEGRLFCHIHRRWLIGAIITTISFTVAVCAGIAEISGVNLATIFGFNISVSDKQAVTSSVTASIQTPQTEVFEVSSTSVLPTFTSTATNTPEPLSNCIELLKTEWVLQGKGPIEAYEHNTDPNSLMGKTKLQITYDLNKLNALSGDASAIIFDQPYGGAWHFISLSDYGQNGFDGTQIVTIPLSDFSNLELDQPIGTLHTRFWHNESYTVSVFSIKACD